MIPNFLNIVQQDMTCISNYLTKLSPANKEQDEKASKAALRMLAVLGMALAGASLVGAFTATTAGIALSKLAMAVVFYVFSHDVFVMLVNSEKGVVDTAWSIGKGLVADAVDFLSGEKSLEDGLRHPLAEGTLLRPLWDKVLWNEALSES